MTEVTPSSLTHAALEAENACLRAALAQAGIDARSLGVGRSEPAVAHPATDEASRDLAGAGLEEARTHDRLAAEAVNLGYTVIEAADSVAGLQILRSDVHIDLLITDVGLPGGMNGRQMADAGRAIRPDLRTLFITGYAENPATGTGHPGPGRQVLTKPFAVDMLAARVRELIAM